MFAIRRIYFLYFFDITRLLLVNRFLRFFVLTFHFLSLFFFALCLNVL